MDEVNPLPGRTTHRLTLDSEQQDRKEEEEKKQRQQRQKERQQKRRRKQEKRKARQQEQKQAQERAEKQAEQRKQQLIKFNDPAKLFEADSDSDAKFSYVQQKIRAMFPKSGNKKGRIDEQSSDSAEDSQSVGQDSEDESSSSSESNQSEVHRERKARKMAKQRNREENERRKTSRTVPSKTGGRIQQQQTTKQKLVQSLAIRWWYVIPQWPPIDYDFEPELNRQGYRLVKGKDFRIADEVVDGLTKVCQQDGYRGVFKSKNGIIDVRPAQGKPCISNFNLKSEQQLHKLVKLAMERQIQQLKAIQEKSDDQKQLLVNLEREFISL